MKVNIRSEQKYIRGHEIIALFAVISCPFADYRAEIFQKRAEIETKMKMQIELPR